MPFPTRKSTTVLQKSSVGKGAPQLGLDDGLGQLITAVLAHYLRPA